MKTLIMALTLASFSHANSYDDVIDPLFAEYNSPSVAGASVTVIKEGKVVYSKGYGLADVENKIAASPSTNYRLASLTKQFTAMAISILLDRGQVRLDETLCDVFPEFPSYGCSIKIEHLLHHQSGLKDYENLISSIQSAQVSDADVLKVLEEQDSGDFTPGSQYRYSNGGYCMLANIVTKRSGKSYAKFVEEEIFKKLGMTHSTIYDMNNPQVENRAYGYTKNGNGFDRTDQSKTSATQGDGGVYTSVGELFLWDQALEKGGLVSPNLMKMIFTPGKLSDGSPTKYGFGWEIDHYQGMLRYGHTGSTIGFRTAIQRFPEKRFSVVVLINREGATPWNIATEIIDKLLVVRANSR